MMIAASSARLATQASARAELLRRDSEGTIGSSGAGVGDGGSGGVSGSHCGSGTGAGSGSASGGVGSGGTGVHCAPHLTHRTCRPAIFSPGTSYTASQEGQVICMAPFLLIRTDNGNLVIDGSGAARGVAEGRDGGTGKSWSGWKA
jgi:hypothetical protein